MKTFRIILFLFFFTNNLVGQSNDEKTIIEHQVKSGETLWHLSMIYDVSIDSIKVWNSIDIKSDKIIADKSLFVKLNKGFIYDFDRARYHIVEEGEYLGDIAALHKLPMDSIIIWNNKSNNSIFKGEILFLYKKNRVKINMSNPAENLNSIEFLIKDEILEQDTINTQFSQVEENDESLTDSILLKMNSLNQNISNLENKILLYDKWMADWMSEYNRQLNELEKEDSNQVLKKLHLSKRKSFVQDSIQLKILSLKAELEFCEIELVKLELLDFLETLEKKEIEEKKDTASIGLKRNSNKEIVEFNPKKIAFIDAKKIDLVVFDNDILFDKSVEQSKKNKKFQSKIKNEQENNIDSTISLNEVLVRDLRKEKYKIGDKVDEMSRQRAEFYLMRAKRELDNQNYTKAEKLINQSLEINPNYVEAYMIKGDLFALFDFYDKALENYEKAKSLDRRLPQIYYNIGNCLIHQGKSSEALMSMRKAITLDPTYVLGYYGRSILYLSKKQYDKAIEDFNTILNLNAYFFPAVKGRGIAHLNKGDFKEAIVDFNTVLNFDLDDEKTLYMRGLAKLYLNNLYEGCLDLLKASEMGYSLADKDLKKYCN